MQGFQQQDSHELLRVLLDGLQTEEAKAITAKLKRGPPQQVLPKRLEQMSQTYRPHAACWFGTAMPILCQACCACLAICANVHW